MSDLPVRTLFDAPSVRGLTQRVREHTSSVELAPVETLKEVPVFRCSAFIRLAGLRGLISLWAITWTAPSSAFNKRKTRTLNPNQFAPWRKPMQTDCNRLSLPDRTTSSAGLWAAWSRTKSPLSFVGVDV